MDAITSLVLLPDGRLASAHQDDYIGFWDPARGGASAGMMTFKTGLVGALAALPDGHLAAGIERDVCLMTLPTVRPLTLLEGHTDTVRSLAVLSGGSHLVSGSADGTLRVWDLAAGACSKVMTAGPAAGGVSALVVLDDGARVAACTDGDKTVRVWDVSSGACLSTSAPLQQPAWCMTSLLGGRFAMGTTAGEVTVMDAATAACTLTLAREGPGITALATLPGNRLASGAADGTVCAWDPDTGSCLTTFTAHSDCVSALVPLPRGLGLASACLDGSLKVWP